MKPIEITTPSTLLLGPPGAGKTHSLTTMLEAGLELFVIVTEGNGLETLLDAVHKKKLDINKLRWKVLTPARTGFKSLIEITEKVSQMTYEDLTKLRPSNQRANAQFLQLLRCLTKFIDDRSGEDFGDVTTWNAKRALVVDSLSGLNLMAMDVVIGDKPTAHQGEWGIAMGALEKLLLHLTSDLKCYFVLTSHLDREPDELTGGTKLMASALGRKLAPKLPRLFSDVVLAYREGESFHWSTSSVQADLKHRALPLSGKLSPSFVPIIEAHERRLKTATTTI